MQKGKLHNACYPVQNCHACKEARKYRDERWINKSTDSNPEQEQTLELANKDITITTAFYMFKKLRNM